MDNAEPMFPELRADAPVVAGVTRAWRNLDGLSCPNARSKVPFELASRLEVLPLRLLADSHAQEDVLCCVASRELSAEDLRTLQFVSGCVCCLEVGDRQSILRGIKRAYLSDKKELGTGINHSKDRLLFTLERAIEYGASDIHFDPGPEGYRVRYRVDGRLREEELKLHSADERTALVRRIQVLCEFPQVQVSRTQEGAFTFPLHGSTLGVRVAIIPCAFGSKIALRLLGHDRFDIDGIDSWERGLQECFGLGLSQRQTALLGAALARRAGCILVGGPTGAGKSTLLHVAAQMLAAEGAHVISIEDPVERPIAALSQVPVQSERGETFSSTLRSILRCDPDVILVGEIRDPETARVALEAGLTGHLVLSTIHAQSVFEICQRLRVLGVSEELMCSAIHLLLTQRLLPRLCAACRREEGLSDRHARLLNVSAGAAAACEVGCPECFSSGIVGRIGAYELLPFHATFRDVSLSRDSSEQRYQLLLSEYERCGLESMMQRLRTYVLEQTVSASAACRALGYPA